MTGTMIIRTILDIFASRDPDVRFPVRAFEEKEAKHYGIQIKEREDETGGFLR
jgi:hypothetical protein